MGGLEASLPPRAPRRSRKTSGARLWLPQPPRHQLPQKERRETPQEDLRQAYLYRQPRHLLRQTRGRLQSHPWLVLGRPPTHLEPQRDLQVCRQ